MRISAVNGLFSREPNKQKEGFRCFAIPESLKSILDEIAYRERIKKSDAFEGAIMQDEQRENYDCQIGERWVHTSAILSVEAVDRWRHDAHYSGTAQRRFMANALYSYLKREYGQKHPDLFDDNMETKPAMSSPKESTEQQQKLVSFIGGQKIKLL